MIRSVIGCILVLLAIPSNASAQGCAGNPVAVQILGSGAPPINPNRALTSYLLWVGAQAKILVDAGGGASTRFGQSQAKLSDLSMIAISHVHPDHASDLPALLWLSNQTRKDRLPIVGPSGNAVAPNFSTFLSRLFDEKTGAFQVLGATVGGAQISLGGGVPLDISVVDVTKAEPSTVFDRDGVIVTALGIPYSLPPLAYRVQTRGVSVVFSSNQNGTNPEFVKFAKCANVLIMHLTLPARATRLLQSHAPPAVVGRVAHDAGVGRLIVSHIGQFDLDPAIAELKKSYAGRPLTIGADLQCTPVQ